MAEFTPIFEDWFQKTKEAMQPEEKKKRTAGKIDTRHFDRLSPERQRQLYDYARARAKDTQHGQP